VEIFTEQKACIDGSNTGDGIRECKTGTGMQPFGCPGETFLLDGE
jgi:hypothetical protein